jgi:isopentenyl-diphosphate delta-isomerase
MERVVLVDDDDREVGTEEKQAAHVAGLLHRAFSIFVFNRAGELLLQRRSLAKYHSAGQWSNTCCGHPRPGEPLEAAAHRRLREEMGFDCALRLLPPLRYRAQLDNGLVENELDHILIGAHEGDPLPDPEEVGAWRWVDRAGLGARIASHPGEFTAWLRLIVAHVPGVLGGGGGSEEALPVPEAP